MTVLAHVAEPFCEAAPAYWIGLNQTSSNQSLAIQYVPTYSYTLRSLGVALQRHGSPTGTIKWSVYSDNAGAVGTLIATSTAVLVSTVGTSPSYSLVAFGFPFPYVSLTAGTTYWFVSTISYGTSNTVYVGLGYPNTSGAWVVATWNGSAWDYSSTGIMPCIVPSITSTQIELVSGPARISLCTSSSNQKVAGSFVPASSYTVKMIAVGVQCVGATNNSNTITLSLCANNAGVPGSVLASGVASMTVGYWVYSTVIYCSFKLDSAVALTQGTTYWIVISCSYSPDASNYVKLACSANYDGTVYLWDGANWAVSAGAEGPIARYIFGGVIESSFSASKAAFSAALMRGRFVASISAALSAAFSAVKSGGGGTTYPQLLPGASASWIAAMLKGRPIGGSTMNFGATMNRQGQKALPAAMAAMAGALARGRLLVAAMAASSAALARQVWRTLTGSTTALSAALLRGRLLVAATVASTATLTKTTYRNVASAATAAMTGAFAKVKTWTVAITAATASMAGAVTKLIKRPFTAS